MSHISQGRVVPVHAQLLAAPFRRRCRRPLTEADAVDIWIARWLRIRRKDLLARYGCDPRRLYEIWEEKRFAGSRAKALKLFAGTLPGPGRPHRLRPPPHHPARRAAELQPGLFDRSELQRRPERSA